MAIRVGQRVFFYGGLKVYDLRGVIVGEGMLWWFGCHGGSRSVVVGGIRVYKGVLEWVKEYGLKGVRVGEVKSGWVMGCHCHSELKDVMVG